MNKPLLIACTAFALHVSAPAWSLQGAPPVISSEALTASSISSKHESELSAYVDYWIPVLMSSKVDDPGKARDNLRKPLQSPGLSGAFRVKYGSILIQKISPTLKADNEIAAQCGFAVLGAIQTPEAVDALLAQMDPRDQRKLSYRQAAAGRLAETLTSLLANKMPLATAKQAAVARQIAALVRDETQWSTVQRELEALSLLSRGDDSLIPIQAGAMKDLIDRIDRDPARADLMIAVADSLRGLLNQYLVLPKPRQVAVGPQNVEPMLVAALKTVQKHWDTAQANPSLKAAFGNTVQRGEVLLGLIAKATQRFQPTGSQLHDAWKANDRAKFDAGLKNFDSAKPTP